MRFLGVVPAAGICFAIGMSAQAHQVNLSTARVTMGGDRIVAVEVALKGSDADRLASTNVFDMQRDSVDPAQVAASAQQIIAYVERACRRDKSRRHPLCTGYGRASARWRRRHFPQHLFVRQRHGGHPLPFDRADRNRSRLPGRSC